MVSIGRGPDAATKAGHAPSGSGTPSAAEQDKALAALLERANLTLGADGGVVIKDISALNSSGVVDKAKAGSLTGAGELDALPPPTPPALKLTPEHVDGAEAFARNLDTVLTGYLTFAPAGALAGAAGRQLRDFSQLSADALVTEFLKLQLKDPNNSPETHAQLHDALSNLRQLAIDTSKKLAARAHEMLNEAREYAENAEVFGQAMTGTTIAVTLVLSIATFGMGAAPFILGAMAAGAIVGAMVDKDNPLDGAIQGMSYAGTAISMAYGFGLVSWGMQMGAQAAKDAANVAVKQVQDVAQRAAKEAAQKAAREAVAKGMTESQAQAYIQQEVRRAVEQAAREALKDVPKEALQRIPEVTTQDGARLGLRNALEEGTKQGLTDAGQGISDQAMRNIVEKGVDVWSKDLAKHTAQQLAETKAFRLFNTLRVGTQAGSELAEAGVEVRASQLMANARLEELGVTRQRQLMEMLQQQLEEEQRIMQDLMQLHNSTIQDVLKWRERAAEFKKSFSNMLVRG